jgi:hypothetical protein
MPGHSYLPPNGRICRLEPRTAIVVALFLPRGTPIRPALRRVALRKGRINALLRARALPPIPGALEAMLSAGAHRFSVNGVYDAALRECVWPDASGEVCACGSPHLAGIIGVRVGVCGLSLRARIGAW